MKKVVLIDDSKLTLRKMTKVFNELNFETILFTNPEDAINEYELYKDDVGMIVTDYHMPELTGEEVVRKLIALKCEIPIIVCTADKQMSTKDMVLNAGAKAVVNKPFLYSKDNIKDYLEKWKVNV